MRVDFGALGRLTLGLLAREIGLISLPLRTRDVPPEWIEQVGFCVTLWSLVTDADRFGSDTIGAQLLRQPEFCDFLALAAVNDSEAGKFVPGLVSESIKPVDQIT